ncbi:2-dehydropantoate 2-reductase [Methyloligella halotolerans]|uniref:2-dehydropantoate 2-reductase n=2 Tax=Methyloligella halotolerans TaxID=1177755 RepID=A0A1E2RVT1_9HYPH|nr:2-dehydropantoate 2-reductase [Methyloligella halotolerans]
MQEMWEKFVFLATYAGMTTLMRAPVGAIVATQEGEAIIREMMEECTATAAASGYAPRVGAMRSMVDSLTERGSKGTASMYRDMVDSKRTEHEHILGDMLERARAANVPAPLLRISLTNMQAYDQERAAS